MAGRPPGRPLDPEDPGKVLSELSPLIRKSRLTIPKRFLERLDWFCPGASHEVLLSLPHSGMASVWSWKQHGDSVLRARENLIRDSAVDSSLLGEVALLEQRFCRATLSADCRLRLTDPVLVHLEERPDSELKPWFFLISLPDRIEIWARSFRARQLRTISSSSYGLPEE